MTPKKTRPWDQLPGESNESYARFLLYRNLGIRRSLKRAYAKMLADADLFSGDPRKLHLPANWRSDSSAHRWVARSSAWDLHHLAMHGSRVALLHIQAMLNITKKYLKATEEYKIGDDEWDNVLATSRHVAQFLTPEIVRDIEEGIKNELQATVSGELDGQLPVPTSNTTTTGPVIDPDE
jgi:hypothetical protein